MNIKKGFGVRLASMAVVFVITVQAGFSVMADELLMKDGSRLLGTVVKEDGGVVEFKTSYAGVIKVKWQEISEVITDEPITVLMNDHETIDTKHVKNTEAGLVLAKESDGTAETVSESDVAYVNPEPWRLGKGMKWSGNINVDLNYERGNSDKDEYNGDWKTTFRWRNDRLKFYGDYEREKSNDVLTDDNWRINGRYDHFVTEKFFYGANLGMEHDRPADLQRRTIVGPLVGYEFYESTAMNLDVAGGPMYVNEEFYAADNRDYLALGWAVDFDRFLIPDRMQFYHRHRGLLEPGDTDNLVWDAWTGFRFPIYAGIVATTEVLLEYDGGAPDGVDDTDTTYNLKLGYQW
jgi:putative salt-induced outer membrane protein YdiY